MNKFSDKYLRQAHGKSIYHESEIKISKLCGCFHCNKLFDSNEIIKWTDEQSIKDRTAICPHCGIDSILDDRFPIDDKEFLIEMNKMWFGNG